MARSLLQALGSTHAVNPELLAQSDNSVAITAALLRQAQAATPTGDTLIDAEQALLWGHALHPTPKSREGVALAQVLACAPEARAAFALYWFRIDRACCACRAAMCVPPCNSSAATTICTPATRGSATPAR